MRLWLPKLMVWLTQHDRYLPEIEWSDKSWTHNIFRVYEKLFWRRVGIRAEMSASSYMGKVTYQAHTFEAFCCLIEQAIRTFEFKLPFKVWIPLLMTPEGLPMPASPYLFAIAFDNHSDNHVVVATSNTVSYTTSGSNRILWTGILGNLAASDSITGSTYAGVSLFQTNKDNSTDRYIYLQGLANAATGTNNLITSANTTTVIGNWITSYTGAATSGQPDNHSTADSTGTITCTLTTVANNCWLMGVVYGQTGIPSPIGGTVERSTDLGQVAMVDNNTAISPAGSASLTLSVSPGTSNLASCFASFSPAFASQVLKVSGVAQASISKVSKVTNANARKISGVQNQP